MREDFQDPYSGWPCAAEGDPLRSRERIQEMQGGKDDTFLETGRKKNLTSTEISMVVTTVLGSTGLAHAFPG